MKFIDQNLAITKKQYSVIVKQLQKRCCSLSWFDFFKTFCYVKNYFHIRSMFVKIYHFSQNRYIIYKLTVNIYKSLFYLLLLILPIPWGIVNLQVKLSYRFFYIFAKNELCLTHFGINSVKKIFYMLWKNTCF